MADHEFQGVPFPMLAREIFETAREQAPEGKGHRISAADNEKSKGA